MVIPVLSWETAQAAPHPDRAWTNRPKQETEPLFRRYADGKLRINTDNYCLRVEYETLRSHLGCDLGCPVPSADKKEWSRRMFEKYDPEGYRAYMRKRAEGQAV